MASLNLIELLGIQIVRELKTVELAHPRLDHNHFPLACVSARRGENLLAGAGGEGERLLLSLGHLHAHLLATNVDGLMEGQGEQ